MSVGVGPLASAAMLQGLLGRLGSFAAAGTLELHSGVRPLAGGAAPAPAVAVFTLAQPAGTVNASTGEFIFTAAPLAAITETAATPTWARMRDGSGAFLLDFTARLHLTADNPADPAHVVVYLDAAGAGVLVRLTAAALRF